MNRKYYGMPYQGSKNLIAREILAYLPSGDRFVDLFGGGGSMTDCAMHMYKWDRFLYNEINPLVAKAFRMALNGEFKDEKRWIDRETFKKLKDTDPYVAICFSFGNNMTDYAYGEDVEPYKKALHYAWIFNDYSLLNELKEQGIENERLKLLQSLQAVKRIKDMENRERLNDLEITCDSYENYEYKEGDVVYCDIPYETTNCKAYKGFDHKKFYDWCATRPYRVFFSSYEISDNRFHRIMEIEKRALMNTVGSGKLMIECLYTNEPYANIQLISKQYELDL